MAANMLLTLRSPHPAWLRSEVELEEATGGSGSTEEILDFFFLSVELNRFSEMNQKQHKVAYLWKEHFRCFRPYLSECTDPTRC